MTKDKESGPGEPLPHLAECIYLDYNATTPIFPEVAAAMAPYTYECFGNPSSTHAYGKRTKAAVAEARQQVAFLVNADPSEIYFTSCGTESNNWALTGAVLQDCHHNGAAAAAAGGADTAASTPQGTQLPHVVTSTIEHPAVLACLEALAKKGLCTYTAVPVDPEGLVSPADVAAAITPATVLVSIMHSNNEVGSIQPIAEISAAACARGVLMHCDAAQSVGKVVLDVKQLGVDLMTLVGHKLGAPKGVAALYIRNGVNISNLLVGGGQEGGRRAGTENVLLIAGLGAAARVAREKGTEITEHMRAMRDTLQQQLLAALPKDLVRVNGPTDPSLRLPNTLSISIQGIQAAAVLQQVQDHLAASAAAACHSSGGPAVSAVLQAMQIPEEFAVGTLRLSTGRHTTPAEIDQAVQLLVLQMGHLATA